MKLHTDPENPTIILDEDNRPVADTGIQDAGADGGFSVNAALAAELVRRFNAAERPTGS